MLIFFLTEVNTFNNTYIWFPIRWVGVRLSVLTLTDAHIAISDERSEENPLFETWIGTEENTRTKMFTNRYQVQNRATTDILSGSEHRNFTVGWYNDIVTMFVDGFPLPLVSYNMNPSFEVHYFGIRTW